MFDAFFFIVRPSIETVLVPGVNVGEEGFDCFLDGCRWEGGGMGSGYVASGDDVIGADDGGVGEGAARGACRHVAEQIRSHGWN